MEGFSLNLTCNSFVKDIGGGFESHSAIVLVYSEVCVFSDMFNLFVLINIAYSSLPFVAFEFLEPF